MKNRKGVDIVLSKFVGWIFDWKVVIPAGILVFLLVVYFMFQFSKWVNYSFQYEKRVKGTICEMVEHEHLKPQYSEWCK